MDRIATLLKDLTEAPGVPGYDEGVRKVVMGYSKPLGALATDRLGSVLCTKQGRAARPRVRPGVGDAGTLALYLR